MNIGIVIAVSEYKDPSKDLPGCVKDGQLIKDLLEATRKFEKILYLAGNDTESIKVKRELTELVSENKEHEVNELFFYYTGHGDLFNNEFYYILSDFNSLKRKQTSLDNSELDDLLRQIKARLTVKVIDACHSGVEYIKDNDVYLKYFDESKQRFECCYFMFSSMNNQSSYQSDKISDFTRSFAKAVVEYKSNEIRYKDIIDCITDDFENNPQQTPFFVIQAPLTDKFCSITTNLKQLALSFLIEDLTKEDKATQVGTSSLEKFVKAEAKEYCSKEEMLDTLNRVKNFIESYEYLPELISLYSIKASFLEEPNNKTNTSAIGNWLIKNENSYFAEVKTDTRSKADKTYKNKSQTLFDRITQSTSNLINREIEEYISGADLTTVTPFKLIEIDAEPNYQNLKWYDCTIYFLVSKNEIRFFYIYSVYKELDWNSHSLDTSTSWQTINAKLKDFSDIESSVLQIIDNFSSHILNPIKARYQLALEHDGLLGEDNNPNN